MKKILYGVLVGAMLLTSCKKSSNHKEDPYTCTTCTQTPEGKAANDNSSKGIYKGVIIGSSGTIKFDIANTSSNSITATMVIDGKTVTLTTTTAWNAGQLYVAPFKGTLNGQEVTINFSVGASGSGATITSATIPGHANAIFSIAKETSTALVRCFEGTYETSNNEKGTFNIIVSTLLKGWTGKARENGSQSSSDISGTYVNNTLIDESGATIAPIDGDEFSGSFKNSKNVTITVKGKRTL
ncbi:hypothetical protein Pedsa_3570 [Pseudopedobacter saltans DSM 12145]|uniref:Lipoprotein n=1 Tax=Pseudopedobacter saltans (strain ATCC 51119 / DSM 12145 / JCM 21818 / CCUG 39354 / LMG 10337 / NBRC 100064 / NCIMB 13643) TaxID=762903 RepID=F0SF31_PSESL|nr:hypothetical protein [Pseudopedobacter saltans]ADY54099.1 hypothetical protein Pedsa_3570 [Pseudopedobacter saltans DSM 12145]